MEDDRTGTAEHLVTGVRGGTGKSRPGNKARKYKTRGGFRCEGEALGLKEGRRAGNENAGRH